MPLQTEARSFSAEFGHPLAQKIVERCKAFTPDPQSLSFDYSHSGKKISIFESLIGKSGYMSVVCQTVSALELRISCS